MIRSGEMAPAPDVINVLLMAFDGLRDLLNNYQTIEQADTTEILVALAGMVSANLAPAEKEWLIRAVKVDGHIVHICPDPACAQLLKNLVAVACQSIEV